MLIYDINDGFSDGGLRDMDMMSQSNKAGYTKASPVQLYFQGLLHGFVSEWQMPYIE